MQLSLGETEEPRSSAPVEPVGPSALTVSQLTARVKGLLEGEIGTVWVRGEISGLKPSPSGHVYLSLKDSGAVISCALFKGVAAKLKSRVGSHLRDGVEVLAFGRVSVYAPRGSYQLILEHMEPVGSGALQLAFEQLKAKLMAEGLFAPSRKRPIPAHPQRVVLITSPTGAVLQDMLNVLGRRNSGLSLLVIPTLVQGEAATPQIVRAIEVANKFRLGDVLIVARGGGSLEDLWCFNEESVVRAVAASEIPVISAVGHEVDFTLCDFAADLRAPTPSAAAELVTKSRLELLESLENLNRRLTLALAGRLNRLRASLLAVENRLVSPAQRLSKLRLELQNHEQRLIRAVESRIPVVQMHVDELFGRIKVALDRHVAERQRVFSGVASKLEALSPLKVLGRGYTLVEDGTTRTLLKSVAQLHRGQQLSLVFHDGRVHTQVL